MRVSLGISHDLSSYLLFLRALQWQPKNSNPSAEAFVRECRTTSVDLDIMGTRASYHQERIAELVKRFPQWREERLPGARAFQSTYDK